MRKIYYNAQIITVDDRKPSAEAVLVENGKIAKVGTNDDVLAAKDDDTEVINVDGKTLLPGFCDGHSHLSATAYDLVMVNLKPEPGGKVDSVEALIEAFKEKAESGELEEGQWLMGMGLDPASFTGTKTITKYDLDKASKDIPICAIHASGHVAYLNSTAMEKVGYVGEFTVPEGGAVPNIPGTDDPSGLVEEAAYLGEVQAKMVPPSGAQVLKSIMKAEELYASYGITTTQDAFTDSGTYPLLKAAADNHMLYLDVTSYVGSTKADELLPQKAESPRAGYTNHYRMGGAKMFLDGSPQAKTAWLTQPYYIAPEGKDASYKGFPVMEDEQVYAYCKKCLENNWQLHTHCNGDAAADQLIRCYKKAQKDTGNYSDLRPVMIHAQTVREDQLDEMKEIGMIISFFLDHIYYWGDWHYESVFGPERAARISPAKSALNRGINFTLHQDTPVVAPDTLLAMHNAVNRTTKGGRVLGEEQRISVMEAIKALTINGAYQYFEEDIKGSVTEGKLADFVILDKNPLETDVKQLKDIKVLETIKEGNTVYKA